MAAISIPGFRDASADGCSSVPSDSSSMEFAIDRRPWNAICVPNIKTRKALRHYLFAAYDLPRVSESLSTRYSGSLLQVFADESVARIGRWQREVNEERGISAPGMEIRLCFVFKNRR